MVCFQMPPRLTLSSPFPLFRCWVVHTWVSPTASGRLPCLLVPCEVILPGPTVTSQCLLPRVKLLCLLSVLFPLSDYSIISPGFLASLHRASLPPQPPWMCVRTVMQKPRRRTERTLSIFPTPCSSPILQTTLLPHLHSHLVFYNLNFNCPSDII